jgi:hypothetical protein
MKRLPIILTIFLLSNMLGYSQTSSENMPTTLVQIRVDTAYDDSSTSVALIESIITKLPTTKDVLRPGETLSAFVLRRYGFGPSNLPRSYALIEQAILAANHFDAPERIKPGQIQVPVLPRRALTSFNENKLLNFAPKVSVFSGMHAARAGAQEAPDYVYNNSTRHEQNRPASQSEVLDIPIPISAVNQVMTDPVLSQYGTLFDYPIAIDLASGSDCDSPIGPPDHRVLLDGEKNTIAQLLSQPGQRDGLMFVLDTGWPDPSTFKDSREQLWSLLDAYWRRNFSMGLPHSMYSTTYKDPTNFHCRCIERALKEFRDLDVGKHVKVVYLPMTQEQGGDAVIQDLLQTSYLYEWEKGKQLKPPQDVLSVSRQYAVDAVSKQFPLQWSGNRVTTDKALLDAVLLLGDEYADMRSTYLFINESWTVNHKEYYLRWPSPLHGAVIAATGNADENVADAMRDFADRSSLNKDTIAIMNMEQGSGFVCSSSYIDERDIDAAMAIAYDGRISADLCGTSFAAPRVAWILAADESMRKQAIQPQRWSIELQKRLVALRDPNSQKYDKLWFWPGKFLSSAQ